MSPPTITYENTEFLMVEGTSSTTSNYLGFNVYDSTNPSSLAALSVARIELTDADGITKSSLSIQNGMVVNDVSLNAVAVTPSKVSFVAVGSEVNSLTLDASANVVIEGLKPSFITDGAGTVGASTQLLSAGAGGELLWVDPSSEFPNLAQVLAVATAGDAGDLPISNLSSLTLADTTTVLSSNSLQMGATPLVISADASGFLALNTIEVPKFSTTLASYVPMSINGTVYYMQLYAAT